jgi:two-component system phosphate regulon sensor histidine kinase PhoR
MNKSALSQFPNAQKDTPIAFSLRNPELLSAIEKVKNSTQAQLIEIYQNMPNPIWFDTSISYLKLQKDKSYYIVISMHNISEQKLVEAMRSDFIANASHELRTPLASLSGFIETMQGPAKDDQEAREKFLKIMASQVTRMSKLIDDLLSLSKIEMSQHIKPTDKVDLISIILSVVEGLQTQAKQANIKLIVKNPKEKIIINGDKEELIEVFENLIDNAIKYGAGGLKVEIEIKEAGLKSKFDYNISITDFGAGVSAQHVPRLTERFYRVNVDSSRKKKGTGLGLAIVKHILNRHGGLLNIKSKLGSGTSVEVFLRKKN